MKLQKLVAEQMEAFQHLEVLRGKRQALENVVYAIPYEAGRRNCQNTITRMGDAEDDLMDSIAERGRTIAALAASAE